MKKYPVILPLKWMLGLSLLLLTGACAGVGKPAAAPVAPTGSFTLFLQPLPQEVHRLTFLIEEMTALRAEGGEVPLPLRQSRFQADSLIGVQKKLANLTLPPGNYRGIALRIRSAILLGEEGEIDLLPPDERLLVDHSFMVRENQTQTLFLSLSADRLITDGVFFTPRFSLWQAERTLVNLKGFVSSGASRDLIVFNKRTVQVVGAIHVGGRPADMALDQQRGWLYVALPEENAIVAVEVNSEAILGRVQLRFGDRPTELALTANGALLVALNPGSASVSIIDTGSLVETGRVGLSSEPNDVFIDAGDSRAYVTHAAHSRLSVIDLQSRTARKSVALDESPLDGVADGDGRSLYLINDFSPELSVLDTASLASRRKIFIGNGALSIKADDAGGLLYVSMEDGGIAVVDPRSLMAIDNYALLPEPVRSLAIEREENALFAVMPQSGVLMKVDLVGKRELGRLDIDADSRTVVVMGER